MGPLTARYLPFTEQRKPLKLLLRASGYLPYYLLTDIE
jgi:hypothetical protein